MVIQILICALAAAGVILLAWLAAAAGSGAEDSLVSIYVLRDGDTALEHTARSFDRLCEAGLLRSTLLVVELSDDAQLHALAQCVCNTCSCVSLCRRDELQNILNLE